MVIETDRLVIRPVVETDRARFVELFTDKAFMVFASDELDASTANERFDRMRALNEAVPYAKQPVIDKSTGVIIGYTGAGIVMFEGVNRLEWGWRLTPEARGRGLATEAVRALMDLAHTSAHGEMLCIIDIANAPSRRVAEKVGYRWWKRYAWPESPGDTTDLFTTQIGSGGPPLLAPSAHNSPSH